MNLKNILILLTLGLNTLVHGQDIAPCKIGQNEANLLLSNGEIYFPRLTVKSTYTLRKLLELEYGIKDEIYDNGSDLEFGGEAECFFEVMKAEIDKKWGKDFLKKQRRIANSLDNDGKGYKDPKENGLKDSITAYLKKEHSLDIIKNNFLVTIKISSEKEILDVGVLTGLPRATEISRERDDYRFIKEAVHKADKVYEPGQLRGKYIESTIKFWIEI